MTRGRARHVPGTRLVALLATLIVLEGVAAVRTFAAFAFGSALLTLASGWIVAGCGLVAWRRVPASRTGPLLVATGATLFLGPFGDLGYEPLGAVAAWLTWIHIPILAMALFTPAAGQPTPRLDLALVGILVLVALLPLPSMPVPLAVALAGAIVVHRLAAGTAVRGWSIDGAGLLVALGLTREGALGSFLPVGAVDPGALRLATLAIAAIVLTADLLRDAASRGRMTDLVLRLDPSAPTSLAGALRRATGDPTLDVGYRLSSTDRFVDVAGRGFPLPVSGSGRVVTPVVGGDGEAIAVLVHARRIETDPGFLAAVARAAALATANAQLQAELRAQVAAVRASRRRIVAAADEERRALERRLGETLLPRLERLARRFDAFPVDAEGAIERVREQLVEVEAELARLADGLHPRALERQGLDGALAELAGRSPVPVELDVDELPGLPPTTAALIWFVCSEALANIAKHALAAHVRLTLHDAGPALELEITDDGIGGADPSLGTGLRGIGDRVEAAGGTLDVRSDPGAGTRLLARLPRVVPA